MTTSPTLSQHGHRLREILAEQGFELTPDEFAASIQESVDRVQVGHCLKCGSYTELRFGHCFDCCDDPSG